MYFLNEYDIEDVFRHYADPRRTHNMPNAMTAARSILRLAVWTNENSDGWPYWVKPQRASQALQTWLGDWRKRYTASDDSDLTDAELTAMLRPVKAFLTRQGADWREVLG